MGVLLLACLKKPDHVKKALRLISRDSGALSILKTGLGVLVGLGAAYRTNRFLSDWALNNFVHDSWNWKKEVILITGASSGLGERLARTFATLGITVMAVDLNPPGKPFSAGVAFYQLDVTDSAAIKDVSERIRQDVGSPTVLINNAGIGIKSTILDQPIDMVQRTFDINVVAHFRLVKEFLPYMVEKNHGHIVMVASTASFVTLAGHVDYSCTKAAALAFHEGLTQELKHRYDAPAVRTTIVHPYWTKTPMTDELMQKPGFNDIIMEADIVVNAMVNQVLRGKSGQLVLPERLTWFATALRGLPSWLQDRVLSQKAYHM